MRAGKLRHRVTIQQQTKTQDSTGSVIPSWSALATVWAAIEPLSGRELFSASQVQSSVTTRIRIRARDGITPKMRVLHGSTVFDIEAVLPDPTKNREIHLMCINRGAAGFRDG